MGMNNKVSFVCDTCKKNNEGVPACVDYCPKEALAFVSIKDIEKDKVKTFQKSLQDNVDVPAQ